jgi:hypothetical protein
VNQADWVHHTDRKDEVAAFDRLLGTGGCLVLCGGPRAGHNSFAQHLHRRAEENGRTVISYSRVGGSSSIKRALLGVWEKASPPPPKHVIPRWNIPGPKLSLSEIVDGASEALQRREDDSVLFLETPDRYDRLMDTETAAIAQVASQSGCPIVVTSLTTSTQNWRSLAGCEAMRLTEFSEDDILEVMIAQPFVHGKRLEEVVGARDLIMNGRKHIPPEEAYALLQAWGENES